MKKFILLFGIIVIGFTSCSKDDDKSTQDPFIGTWTSYQEFKNGNEIALDDCDKKDKIIVKSDGTFLEEYFYDIDGLCESDGVDNGQWENIGDNIYKIIYYPETNDEEVLTVTIIFSNNTFSTEIKDGQDTYKSVYIRN